MAEPPSRDRRSTGAERRGDHRCAQRAWSRLGGNRCLRCAGLRCLIGDTRARVAALADVIRSKRTAARPKDLRVLPTLEQYARSRGIELGDTTE